MKITAIKFYGGSDHKASRLGMAGLFFELMAVIFDTEIEILEVKNANGAAVIREALDERLSSGADWVKTASGGVDWVKKLRYNSTILVRMGVEVQVSARSDLLIRDVVHLRNSLQTGIIDIGVIVVPSDRLAYCLTDRTPSFKDAVRLIEREFPEATTFPIALIAVEHDRPGNALPKKVTNRGEKTRTKLADRAPSETVGEPEDDPL